MKLINCLRGGRAGAIKIVLILRRIERVPAHNRQNTSSATRRAEASGASTQNEYNMQSPPEKRRRTNDPTHSVKKKKIVVLDVDGTLLSQVALSLVFQIFRKFKSGIPVPSAPFIDRYLAKGGIRPWVVELFKTLAEWKATGRIKRVLIYTAARNDDGWVTFLKDCLEEHAGTSGLIEECMCREDCEVRRMHDGGVIAEKDLTKISEENDVVIFEDKPEWVKNANADNVIKVTQYKKQVCMQSIEEWITGLIPAHAEEIANCLQRDRDRHLVVQEDNSGDHSGDDSLWLGAQRLAQLCPIEGEDRQVSNSFLEAGLPPLDPLRAHYDPSNPQTQAPCLGGNCTF